MHILVTGGAGYIGSHTVRMLLDAKYQVSVIDNLSTGHRQAIDPRASFYEINIADKNKLTDVLKAQKPECIIHFAANSLVGESMAQPLKYYENNVHGTQKLLEAMVESDIKSIVFSSTAAIYGEPQTIPIVESDEARPTNTYGETKLTMEKMMHWASVAHGITYVSLRYFNVAGAHESGTIGEDHTNETHLIPIILQVANGTRDSIAVYGNNYPTNDGTCIRDYIHVEDLANAHLLAAEYLVGGGESDIFNLGSQNGSSVLEIIQSAERITSKSIPYIISDRRLGDPAKLVASSQKIQDKLGWKPNKTTTENIVTSAWKWHKNNPNGYTS